MKSRDFKLKRREKIKDDGDIPVEKSEKKKRNGTSYYPRKRETILTALERSKGLCEFNNNHKSFKKKNDKTYLESHHIISMCYQDDFDKSIDIPSNVVCLCSECHNIVHYGKESPKYIEFLYSKRKKALKKAKYQFQKKNC